MFCANCGEKNAENVKFCKACGTAATGNMANDIAAEPSVVTKHDGYAGSINKAFISNTFISKVLMNKALFIIPVLVIVLAVAGFLLFPMFGGGLDETQTPTVAEEDELEITSQLAAVEAVDPVATLQYTEPEDELTQGSLPGHITVAGERISTALTSITFSEDLNPLHANLTNADIVDLRYMTNLTSILIRGTQITDLTPISGLTNLEFLTVQWGLVSDLTPLANLTNLREVHLQNNRISDVAPLANLPNLVQLSLWGNPITDWSLVDHVANVRGQEALYLTTANLHLRQGPSTSSSSLGLFPPDTEVWLYERAYPEIEWFNVKIGYGNSHIWGFMRSDFLVAANLVDVPATEALVAVSGSAYNLAGSWDSWASGRGIAAVVSATPFQSAGGGIGVIYPRVNPSYFYLPLKLEFDGDSVTAIFEFNNVQGSVLIGRQAGRQHSHFEVLESDDFWGYSYMVSSTMPFSIQGNRIEFLFHNRPSFIADFSVTQDTLTIDGVQFRRTIAETPTQESHSAPAPTHEFTTAQRFSPGTHQIELTGYGGPMIIEIVLSETRIESIAVLDHSETPIFLDMVMSSLPDRIIAAQSTDVDIVSGATGTSNSIILGVNVLLELFN